MQPRLTRAEQEAVDYGIDLNLLLLNLELTVQQRIEQHQRALDMVNELKKNFDRLHGIPPESSQNSD